jgi:hypothetical protein
MEGKRIWDYEGSEYRMGVWLMAWLRRGMWAEKKTRLFTFVT